MPKKRFTDEQIAFALKPYKSRLIAAIAAR